MTISLPTYSKLNTAALSRVFDNKSECYKLFWFQAIMSRVREGRRVMSFEELIDEMIADAWYMVSEYHLNLGPTDNLEFAVDYIHSTKDLKSSEKKELIIEEVRASDDKVIREYKRKLIANVPYRLQSTLMPDMKGGDWDCGARKLAEKINGQDHLMYYFTKIAGLASEITIEPEWFDYLTENQVIIDGWIQYNMISYLQRRNPNVPGIVDKLRPPEERNLTKVSRYWKAIAETEPLRDIYAGELIDRKNMSIDHFVPWSYVAHDEMWNLHPTTRSVNSAKSNKLPRWDEYFPGLCEIEYRAYELVWSHEKIHKLWDDCTREHVNSDEVRQRLYRQGLARDEFACELERVVEPVYMAARNCGFGEWSYDD